MGSMRLTRVYHASAGHRLESGALTAEENARVYGPCYGQHGHNYLIEVTVAGETDPATGMALDLGIVDAAVQATVLSRIDHRDLSSAVPELAGTVTTGEELARIFWEWLAPALPPGALRRVGVVETAKNAFACHGPDGDDEP